MWGGGYRTGQLLQVFAWSWGGKGVPAGAVYKVTIDMFPNVPKGNIGGDFAPTDYEVAPDCFRCSRGTHISRSLDAPHVMYSADTMWTVQ